MKTHTQIYIHSHTNEHCLRVKAVRGETPLVFPASCFRFSLREGRHGKSIGRWLQSNRMKDAHTTQGTLSEVHAKKAFSLSGVPKFE